ncbi:MAG: phosphotransferase, partial [Gammaproteobacteria bacterium]
TLRSPVESPDGHTTITDFTTLRPSFADDGTFETLLDYELSHLRSGIARARLSPAAASLQPVLAAAEAARESVLRGAPLSRVHCHGDVCPRNFFFTPGGAILHDYQMFAWGPRLADVAEGALEFGLLNEAIDLLRVRSFIDGYHAKGSLDTGEIDSLPRMLVLQCAFRLARMLRVSLDFGYPLNERRMRAFADFAESLGRGEFPDSEAA